MILKEQDFILIIDITDDKYLQIGEIVRRNNYPNDNVAELFIVKFADGSYKEYNYKLEEDYICKKLMFCN